MWEKEIGNESTTKNTSAENEPTKRPLAHKIQGHTSRKIPTGHAFAAAPISPLRNVKPIHGEKGMMGIAKPYLNYKCAI